MERDSQDLSKFLNGGLRKNARLSLAKAFAISAMSLNGRSVNFAKNAVNGLIPKATLAKWNNLSSLRASDRKKMEHNIRMENRKKAVKIRESINNNLNELEYLISNSNNKGERETLQIMQAQLIKKIEIKQKALSDEINNQLFRVLEIVDKRLKDDDIPSDELMNMMSVLKDSAAIVGLTGKTPLIAQQFNNIQNAQEYDNSDTKIKAIEVEIIGNEVKD